MINGIEKNKKSKYLVIMFNSGDIVKVLIPNVVNTGYDYRLTAPADLGTFVRVNVMNRPYIGIVYGIGDSGLGADKIRDVVSVFPWRLSVPDLQWIQKMSEWTLMAPGAVLRLIINVPDAFLPPRTEQLYEYNFDAKTRMTDARQAEAVFSCGEVLPPRTAGQLLQRFPHLRLYNAYGPTECTCAVCAVEITPAMCSAPLPVGRLSGAAVEITLEDGEIVLRGESVAPAWGGVYHTGDLGHICQNALYWDGRRDFQFKYKGYRIDPSEVEAALEALEGVERAAVLPRRDSRGQVRGLTVFWEGRGEQGHLAKTLEASLPRYMIPGQWRHLPRLPLNRNGKCDRNALEVLLDGATD